MDNLSYWKNSVGYNVYTKDDPDLLNWLLAQWKEKEKPNEANASVVESFIKFSNNLISQKPVVAMEYIDNGIAIILSTGEKLPFNKTSTIREVVSSINVMGTSNGMAGPRVEPQIDTSVSITGEGR